MATDNLNAAGTLVREAESLAEAFRGVRAALAGLAYTDAAVGRTTGSEVRSLNAYRLRDREVRALATDLADSPAGAAAKPESSGVQFMGERIPAEWRPVVPQLGLSRAAVVFSDAMNLADTPKTRRISQPDLTSAAERNLRGLAQAAGVASGELSRMSVTLRRMNPESGFAAAVPNDLAAAMRAAESSPLKDACCNGTGAGASNTGARQSNAAPQRAQTGPGALGDKPANPTLDPAKVATSTIKSVGTGFLVLAGALAGVDPLFTGTRRLASTATRFRTGFTGRKPDGWGGWVGKEAGLLPTRVGVAAIDAREAAGERNRLVRERVERYIRTNTGVGRAYAGASGDPKLRARAAGANLVGSLGDWGARERQWVKGKWKESKVARARRNTEIESTLLGRFRRPDGPVTAARKAVTSKLGIGQAWAVGQSAWERFRASAGARVASMGDWGKGALERMGKAAKDTVKAVRGLSAAQVGAKIASVATSGATHLVTAAMWLWNASIFANPIMWVALAAAGAALLIYRYWKPISGFFRGLWKGFTAAAGPLLPALRKLGAAFSPIFKPVVGLISPIVKWFKDWLKPVDDVHNAGEKLGLRWGKVLAEMLAGVINMVTGVINLFTSLPDRIGKAVEAIRDRLPAWFFGSGKKANENLAAGMAASAGAPTRQIVAQHNELMEHNPRSPAKRGPLRNLHRLKWGETIAMGMRAEPMVAGMRRMTAATMATVTGGMAAMPPLPLPRMVPGSRLVAAGPLAPFAFGQGPRVTVAGPTGARGPIQLTVHVHMAPGASGDVAGQAKRGALAAGPDLVKLIHQTIDERAHRQARTSYKTA